MSQIKTIKEVNSAFTAKGNEYLVVTFTDDKTSNIFDEGQMLLIREAEKRKCPVSISYEQKGKFWNVKDVSLEDVSVKEDKKDNQDKTPNIPYEHQTQSDRNKDILKAMFLKELGEEIRSGHIEKWTKEEQLALRVLYRQEMFSALGIKMTAVTKPTAPSFTSETSTLSPSKSEEVDNPSSDKMTTEELLKELAKAKPSLRTAKTARLWLTTVAQIAETRIDTDPQGVWDEIKNKILER